MSIKSKLLSILKRNRVYYALVAVLFAVYFFRLTAGVLERPYERWDEQTNVQVVREMLEKGGVFPEMTLLGEPFFEKPPLWYWLNYIIGGLFGVDYLQMRIVSIIAALGIWFLIFYSINKYKPRWLVIAWLVVLVTINQLFVVNAGGVFSSHTFNSADLDALQIFFILASLVIFRKGQEEKKFKWLIVSQVLIGLSVLTKGPVGILLYIIQMIYLVRNKRKIGLQNRQVILLIEIAWTILLPWYLVMSITHGGSFIAEHVGYHVIGRATMALEGHRADPFYYIGVFTNWALNPLWAIEIVLVWMGWRHSRKVSIAMIFAVLYFVIISAIETKLAWYGILIIILISI